MRKTIALALASATAVFTLGFIGTSVANAADPVVTIPGTDVNLCLDLTTLDDVVDLDTSLTAQLDSSGIDLDGVNDALTTLGIAPAETDSEALALQKAVDEFVKATSQQEFNKLIEGCNPVVATTKVAVPTVTPTTSVRVVSPHANVPVGSVDTGRA